ncbi:aspartate/glutamate racemase family protein [Albimonas sp. CAU 1670]|uniref:aspartate/glutamate racemase family protein n=1 Tax=Albimonas sp. CAU 1670 TaxID=3032599 RepID=UPI0023DA4AFB|nr:aspartate/glutamate racemase family protein [Albimonas sp. CAU 1670]MDF2233895.1 aspartate/glutamate racemase family protein [Albimonas sp. CAU 1670]
MRLLILNPNSTASMTRSIAAAARAVAAPGTEIAATNPAGAPPAIQGAADGEAALPHVLALHAAETARNAPDAAIIACFDDTGAWELKATAPHPVIGIGEAGMMAAVLRGRRFSVVTTLAVSVPVIAANAARYGFGERCAKVRASGVPVLALEDDPEASARAVREEVLRAAAEDGVEAVVLGCAGMAHLAQGMAADAGLPVIDGVAAAVRLAEAMHGLPGLAAARAA